MEMRSFGVFRELASNSGALYPLVVSVVPATVVDQVVTLVLSPLHAYHLSLVRPQSLALPIQHQHSVILLVALRTLLKVPAASSQLPPLQAAGTQTSAAVQVSRQVLPPATISLQQQTTTTT